MNNRFVDIIDENTSLKINIIEKAAIKLFGFLLKEDSLLKENKSNTFFLLVDKEKFNKDFVLKKILKRKISKFHNLNIVFSRPFLNEHDIREKIKEIIYNVNKEVKYIHSTNNLNELDIMYISRYIMEKKINLNKFKLLLVLDNIQDFDKSRLVKYIDKYKFVDILRTSNINKLDYKKIVGIVNDVNYEFGSSIEIIQKRNIQEYDFCILLSSNIKESFKSHYIIDKEAYILDITDVDSDVLSKEYKSYQKNKGYIETIFNRVNLNMENFLKTDIGIIYLDY